MSASARPRVTKVMMVSPSAVAGGMEEILFHLAAHASHGAYQPHVICLRDGPLVTRLSAAGIPHTVVPTTRLRDPRSTARTIGVLGDLLRSIDPDVVFSSMPFGHVYSWLPAKRAGVPAIWCQASFPDRPHWTDRLASALPGAGVIALSRGAVMMQRNLPRSPPVELLHPGLDPTRFHPNLPTSVRAEVGVPDDALLIGIVGRLQPWKGQVLFLEMARHVLDAVPSAHFAIVGGALIGTEGDYPDQLRALAHRLGLAHRVIFTGHTERVPEWMAAFDLMVNASRPEPFGMVVIEAMAVGKAVVAVDGGGPADIIEEGVSGLLVDDPTPEAFARAIVPLLCDVDRRQAIGRAARQRVLSGFTVDRMASEFGSLLRKYAFASN